MSKKIRDKKVILITAIIFLSVVSGGYFYGSKPANDKNKNINEITASNAEDQIQNNEEGERAEITTQDKLNDEEALAKEGFVQSEMTRGDNEGEMTVVSSTECTFANDESLEQKGESILNNISDTDVKMTLIGSKDENVAEILDRNDKMEVEQSSKSFRESKEDVKDGNIVPKSLFSADAQVLPVVIANKIEPPTDSETDPYEEIIISHKKEALNAQVEIKEPAKTPPPVEAAPSGKVEQALSEEKKAEHSKAYLNATSTFARLLTKFLQKVDYTKELNDLDQINLPIEIKEIFSELKDFAENNIKNSTESNTKIFPKEGVLDKIAGHFVQVEKISDSRHRNEGYELLSKKLLTLEDYFYSQKFLNEMMGHD